MTADLVRDFYALIGVFAVGLWLERLSIKAASSSSPPSNEDRSDG